MTYNMPSEYPIFHEEFKKVKEREKAVWIMKPVSSSFNVDWQVAGKGYFPVQTAI